VTWVRPVDRMNRGTIWNVTLAPSSPGTIFAGTHDGLFRSADSGVTWKGIHKGMKSYNVLGLAIHPSSPETIYAATAIGIYKSGDGGATWSLLKGDLYATALAMDPRSPSVLYAGTHLGVLKTEDAGAKWAALRLVPEAASDGTAAASGAAASTLPTLPVKRRPSDPATGLKPLPIGRPVRTPAPFPPQSLGY
jgi:photosystem II stability/assembly factor-like uncharacterized protein